MEENPHLSVKKATFIILYRNTTQLTTFSQDYKKTNYIINSMICIELIIKTLITNSYNEKL